MAEVVLHDLGFRQLLQSGPVRRDLERRAKKIAQAAGGNVKVYPTRVLGARVNVPVGGPDRPRDSRGRFASNRLLRAIDAGRD